MEQYHGTTILSERRGNAVALGGDGQVMLGNIVVKVSTGIVKQSLEIAGDLCIYTTRII
jgi:ATP-dependent HslUV protease subunit HslV